MRSISGRILANREAGPARTTDRITGYAESVGGCLRDKDSDQLLADIEDLRHRRAVGDHGGESALSSSPRAS